MSADLHVSCAAVGSYIAHSAATLQSVLTHAGAPVVVHYLHGPGFPPDAAGSLAEMVHRGGGNVEFHEIPEDRVRGLPVVAPFTVAMWYRIFLPELLAGVDRVLYLDADTIVVDSLQPLWSEDLEGRWLGAVTNVFQREHVWRPDELGLARRDSYFNSGVLLFNLAQMRADDRTTALVKCARDRGGEFEWPDQDALNLVLGDRRVRLHPRWNAMNALRMRLPAARAVGFRAAAQARRHPGIVHFEGPGPNKPWHEAADRRSRELYLRHRRRTPWPELD